MGCAFFVNRAPALPVPIVNFLSTIPHALFSLFYPDNCRLCEQALTGITAYPVCQACIKGIQPLDSEYFCALCRTPFISASSLDESGRCALCLEGTRGFDAAYSYGAYDGHLRDLIHLFKYARMRSLDKPLGRLLASALPRDEQIDVIMPVPMHWRRQWSRGFNQAESIARVVARRSGVPLSNGLKRSRKTAAQAGLTNVERRENMKGVFRVARAAAVAGRRVLLVDDVFTTGSTASACASALKQAGAKSVVLLTLARVDRRWVDVPDGDDQSGASS